MTVQRMEHVGIVVEDLEAAKAFFLALGLTVRGEWSGGGEAVDRIVGLQGVQTDAAMLEAPNGGGQLELIRFNAPPAGVGDARAPANTTGLRHLAFAVDDIDATLERVGGELVGEVVRYGDSYRLCYLRGPEGIIVELAEALQP